MSRIGKKGILVTNDVEIQINQSKVFIKGPKGELCYNLSKLIYIENNKNTIKLIPKHKTAESQEIYGLSRSIINNMIKGVSQGFEKKLVIQGVGYRAQMESKTLVLNVGYSHPIRIEPPENIKIRTDKNIYILISGISKERVGQVAAKIRSLRPPEPYKGKGIRYENETIRKKVGKAGK